MEPFGTYSMVETHGDRVLQMIIALGPFVFLVLTRMIIGKSKTLMLAVLLSAGWLALRIQTNAPNSILSDLARPIERLLD